MVYSIRIDEVRKPDLNRIAVRFTLLEDGIEYNSWEISVTSEELAGKTANEKRRYIRQKIIDFITPYIHSDIHRDDLIPAVGQSFIIYGDWSARVDDIPDTGLTTIRIFFTIIKSGLEYVNGMVELPTESMEGLTPQQKRALAKNAIINYAQPIIAADIHYVDVDPITGEVLMP